MPERDGLRQFIRDIATRHERIWREQAAMLNETLAGLRETQSGLREVQGGLREVVAELRDTRDERRAQTRALLQVLDRLENGGAQA